MFQPLFTCRVDLAVATNHPWDLENIFSPAKRLSCRSRAAMTRLRIIVELSVSGCLSQPLNVLVDTSVVHDLGQRRYNDSRNYGIAPLFPVHKVELSSKVVYGHEREVAYS